MHQIGAFSVKTHLGQLLSRVEAGEEIEITRRGVPIARLVPVARDPQGTLACARALKALRAKIAARGQKVKSSEIRSWINQGRP